MVNYMTAPGLPVKKVTPDEILQAVSAATAVTVIQMTGPRGPTKRVEARQVAMWLIDSLGLESRSAIGRRFSGRHVTAVMYSINTLADLMDTDSALKTQVESIRESLVLSQYTPTQKTITI